jgi:P-type Mg2+ transporter
MNIYQYTTYTIAQLLQNFSTSLSSGLSSDQVTKLQQQFGPNTIEEKGISWLTILIRQFATPFTYLLLGAGLLSFFLHDLTNAIVILIITLLNGLLGFFQEYRAEQALLLLKKHITSTVKVLRNGTITPIPSQDLVPGDMIILQPGDSIPADVRFLSTQGLTVDESSLTGESAPVPKIAEPLPTPATSAYTATNLGFLGTTVTSGSATALVIATGPNTTFSSISTLTLQTIRQSGFSERVKQLSNFILAFVLITLVVLFTFHLAIKGIHTDIVQLLLFSLALTVGLAPEALPTVITFALSRGALQLARHNVIVKRLSAIEDLGAITLLCTDKTGTLTENVLTVTNLYPLANAPLLLYALLASKKDHVTEPFDKALWAAATPEDKLQESHYQRVSEIPFDPHKRRNTVLVHNNSYLIICRGAYEEIITHCQPTFDQAIFNQWIKEQAVEGNRVIAIAYKPLPTAPTNLEDELYNLSLAGLIAFQDPIKSTAPQAITRARTLGITIKVLTGDSPEVACAVAQKIGLSHTPDCAITGDQFDKLSLPEKQQALQEYSVFARVSPQQKHTIVTLLRQGNTVGFLGEGINDAPALKAAHVALVVQHASDIAKEASDIILLKKSLYTIIEGIQIGRTVFSNTLKYITALLSSTFGNFYSVAIASLFITFLPLLPLQILLVNLLSDLPMITIATDTVDPDELRKPHAYNLKTLAFLVTILGITSSIFDFVIFARFYPRGPLTLQTNWFIESILTELALIYSIRTKYTFYKAHRPSFILPLFSIIAAFLAIFIPSTSWGQQLFHFQAPSIHDLITIFFIVTAYFIATEAVKLFYYRWSNNHQR